ncbi:MAG: ClbS/DfsB family four-helix bundle protein, partial [Spirochaetaceae bacterium]|jgi:hypothetical protein|nr:ClbS/DfsB family four-helix bundle protein [Spirochaetaceae bacterium]
MPRPTTKEQLVGMSEQNLEKLFGFIDSIPEEFREAEYELNERDGTISDVICHLYEWHLMMERWYTEGMEGKKPVIPAEGYTWITLPDLNREIWKRYRGTPLKEAISMLKKSHKRIMKRIEQHSDEELFTKKYYPWTGTTSLGAYFISSTSSHYDWGLKTVKPIKKQIPHE